MNLALCKCGVDLTVHDEYGEFVCGHAFDAAGTKYRCEKIVDGFLCPRPKHHQDEAVPCGPLTGMKLW